MTNFDWQSVNCKLCPELCKSRTQIVRSTPCDIGGILAVGEAPGADEDRLGEGFAGQAGKTLDRLFFEHGVSRAGYGRANICRCRPPENRKPQKNEMTACLPFLTDLLKSCRPKVVVAVGGTPSNAFCGSGPLWEKVNVNNWSVAFWKTVSESELLSALPDSAFIIPMPHTSPLAFNRNAPSGVKWSEIARKQIKLAVDLSRAAE